MPRGSLTSVLGAKDIAALAIGAGFDPRTQATTAVAIALAESGGDPNAVNSKSGAAGLWQIYPGNDNLLDPIANARAAYGKFQSQGWGAWTTYTMKAYVTFLPVAKIGVQRAMAEGVGIVIGSFEKNPPGHGATDKVPGLSFVGDIARDLAAFFGWITSGSTWIRLGETLAGSILVLLALYILFVHTDTGRKVQTAATKGVL